MINEAFDVNQSMLEDCGNRAWWVRGREDKNNAKKCRFLKLCSFISILWSLDDQVNFVLPPSTAFLPYAQTIPAIKPSQKMRPLT